MPPEPARPVFITLADERWALPMAVLARSISRFFGPDDPVTLYVIANGMLPESREAARRSVHPGMDLQFIDADLDALSGLAGAAHYPVTLYLTLKIGSLLPDDLHKVVYIDSDVMVRRDPHELFHLDMPALMGAVVDGVHPFLAFEGHLWPWKELHLDGQRRYFNLGLLLIDLDRWRAEGIEDRLADLAQRYGSRLTLISQDVFNLALYDRWFEMSPRWNIFWEQIHERASYYALFDRAEVDEVVRDPTVVHFTGASKPWANRSRVADLRFQREWYALAAETELRDHETPDRRKAVRGLVGRVQRAAKIIRHGS